MRVTIHGCLLRGMVATRSETWWCAAMAWVWRASPAAGS